MIQATQCPLNYLQQLTIQNKNSVISRRTKRNIYFIWFVENLVQISGHFLQENTYKH